MSLKSFLLRKISSLYNAVVSAEDITTSKQKWNTLAKKNARYFVLSAHGEDVSEEQFQADGATDYQALVQSDELLSHTLGDFSTKSVLEIGCGIGRITEFFSDNFKEVVGVDISEEMIAQARKRLSTKKNVSLISTDGLTYPLPDASVDFVFSFIVFQHMPDAETVESNVREICRVLKSGGIAKIQLRGVPLQVSKKQWYYGVSFDHDKVIQLLKGLPVQLVREQGIGERYYWITFIKE